MGVVICTFCLTIDWFYPLFIFGRTVSARKPNKNNGNVLTDFDALLKQQIESFDKVIMVQIINKFKSTMIWYVCC